MLTFGEIMTKEVVFYEKDHRVVCAEFCKARDIHLLPAIHKNNVGYKYSKAEGTFKRQKIYTTGCVEANENIFKSIVINRFKNRKVLFVKEDGEFVGVVHFCDYNRSPVYEEIYKKLYKLERGLLYLITEFGGKTLGELEKFKDVNSGTGSSELLIKQDFRDLKINLSEIMKFATKKGILIMKDVDKIHDLRNKIAHSIDLIEKVEYKKGDLKYSFQSFTDLIEGSLALDSALRQVANKAYLMKIERNENYGLKVSQVFEEIFS